jgi:hypothetical protein
MRLERGQAPGRETAAAMQPSKGLAPGAASLPVISPGSAANALFDVTGSVSVVNGTANGASISFSNCKITGTS